MSNLALTTHHLSKAYRLGTRRESSHTLVGAMRELATKPLRNWMRLCGLDTRSLGNAPKSSAKDKSVLWAVNDVSMDIHHGDVVGILGRNGAGKSTLLKILSRITEPTCGTARIRGRVSSLLEVGTGFHPELTGRENVYMNGTILGMRKHEIDRKFDQIVDFSGVEKFLDTPIKRYSSGMQVRLAFAVAAHLEPEILIVDEVLAVGDMEFQRKCIGKMRDVASGGRTVLFVSHNLAAVQALCTRGIVLDRGAIVESGTIQQALDCYQRQGIQADQARFSGPLSPPQGPHIASGEIVDATGSRVSDIRPQDPLRLRLNIRCSENITAPEIGVGIDDAIGARIATVGTYFAGTNLQLAAGDNLIECVIEPLRVRSGDYSLKLALGINDTPVHEVDRAMSFHVRECDYFGTGKSPRSWQGPLLARSTWHALSPMKQSA